MPNSRLNPPDEPESPLTLAADAKRDVVPLFLTEKEESTAPDHQPKGLENPFWRP